MFTHRVDDEILFRLPEERFAEEVAAIVRENLPRLAPWMPWATDDFSVEHVREFIRNNFRQLADNKGFSVQIIFRGQLAGHVGLNSIEWTTRNADIGYWLAAPFEGRGIMTRACRAVMAHAFDKLKLNRVAIYCATGNAKSCAVAERLGFTREGVLRQAEFIRGHYHDLAVYSMLASEWASAKQPKPSRAPKPT